MADRIITVTDPSVVTNDTLSGYNNYSDQDGQLGTTMTPTEATNGKTITLSDGVVHEVTSKPVGTTNGEFSAVVSNSVQVDLSGGGALFEDDFAGTVIDVTTKWNVTIAAPSEMTITQDDELILTAIASAVGVTFENNIVGKTAYSIDTLLVCSYDIQSSEQNEENLFFGSGIIKDTEASINTNRFAIQRTATVGMIQLAVRENSVNTFSEEVALDLTTVKTIKMVVDNVNVTWYYWDASWVQLGTFAHGSSGNWYPMIGGHTTNGTPPTVCNFDNYVLTDSDFATQRP